MRIYSYILICVFLSSFVQAQTISYSPYSVYGIGILKEKTSAYNRALMETGIGIRDDFNLNAMNPAAYTSIQGATQLTELGFFYERDRLKTSELSKSFVNGNLTAINLWLRFSKKWAGTVGLAPYSVVNYNIQSDRNFGDGADATVNYSGRGGLTQAYFGNAFQLTKNLSLGFNASHIFGNIIKEETILSGQSAGLAQENKIVVNRPSIDFGVQYAFPLRDDRFITIGAIAAQKIKLNTSNSIRVYEVNGQDSLYVKKQSIDDFILPTQTGFGISYSTPRHLLAFDTKFKRWEEAYLGDDLKLRNTTRFSVAYEYKGNPKATDYWNFVTVRTGFFVSNNYFSIKNTSFSDWGVSLGAGFPLAGNRGTMNISYNFNSNGTTQNRLIAQSANVIVLDFVFRDLWGIRRKFD